MTAPIDKQPSNEIENILIWVAGQGRMNRVKQAHSAITKIIREQQADAIKSYKKILKLEQAELQAQAKKDK